MKIKVKRLMPYAAVVLLAGVGGIILGRYWILHDPSLKSASTDHENDVVETIGTRFDPNRPNARKPAPLDSSPSETALIQADHAKAITSAVSSPTIFTAPTSGTNQTTRISDSPAKSAQAREVLHLVGVDSHADELWLATINDPRVSAKERQNLIEDLNEAGLVDPKHPTEEDLPLIVARILLIESINESPLDQTNANAFLEVYKDLLNLADVAMGQEVPVR
jgi:hypothetical protein